MMGSPTNELGRDSDEKQHKVLLTSTFYIGVFEITQQQWTLVMGSNPSRYTGSMCPVEEVRYSDIRGSSAGAGWPGSSAVDETSFLGKMRVRANGFQWDLPTEAQWEYACRADTTTALNSGKDLTDTSSCPNVAAVGRYYYNSIKGSWDGLGTYSTHAVVGSYAPNQWGLYDMHGNVWEWCLDGYASYPSGTVTNPVGPTSTVSYRILRGGDWRIIASSCRSAKRRPYGGRGDAIGFRIATSIIAINE